MPEQMHLAFMTFSVLKAPYGDPSVQEFDDRTPDTFAEAESSDGFIDRAKPVEDTAWMTNYQKDWGRWGPFAVPRFYPGGTSSGSSYQAQTLSVWRDLHSVWTFAYRGARHRSALKQSAEWFGQQDWPIFAAWWIPAGHQPVWPEACARLEHLHDHGPAPHAFTFKSAFDPQGRPCRPNAKLEPEPA
ncbi:DUF3291 domain-containing protein [Leisingera methylohalidivorans]|uniref:DUF3291 domain-containing protein n=1 Tax=Leisingera methylohalidivorans DSM 14336 TaxID=999552 RepID=V9VXL5_9RHOB|nr:DUF3291 domain-containing protein [Leisingera methylohalidivorans]AHD02120.1 hypothetical protein METH_16860 [Leisingera methylohalidivorans DSM 14336]